MASPLPVIASGILLKVNRRDLAAIVVGGWFVWGALQMGRSPGNWQRPFPGSTVLVLYANWYSRKSRQSAIVILLPCVMILLPGVAMLRAFHDADT